MSADAKPNRPSSSLLYRLIDSGDDEMAITVAPGHRSESAFGSGDVRISRRQHTKLMAVLRSQIERDLFALFGTRRMSEDTDLSAWPLVERSVLNYGIPDLTGMTGSSIDTPKLQRELVAAIKCYEPRLKPESLSVKCYVKDHCSNDVVAMIEALFGPADALETFAMSVSICLGSGQCRRVEERRAA